MWSKTLRAVESQDNAISHKLNERPGSRRRSTNTLSTAQPRHRAPAWRWRARCFSARHGRCLAQAYVRKPASGESVTLLPIHQDREREKPGAMFATTARVDAPGRGLLRSIMAV